MRAGVCTVTLVLTVVPLGGGACKRRPPPPPAAVAPSPAPAPADPPAPTARAAVDALPPDYDPTVLTQGGADPLQVYLAEPRSPAWAAAVEDVVGKQLDRDVKQVVPGAGGVSIGCRTLSCLILVNAPSDKMSLALAVVGLVTLGPVTVTLGTSPERRRGRGRSSSSPSGGWPTAARSPAGTSRPGPAP
jgi:hypothetical protein